MRKEQHNRQSESGSALVAVLCLVLMGGLLVSAVLAMSKYNSFTMTAHLDLQKSMYLNEGALTRVQYLLAADRTLYQITQPGQTDYSEYDTDRFMADGVVHVMNYYGTPLEFTISDARSGFDLGSGNHSVTLRNIANADPLDVELSDVTTALNAAISDYIDSDDTVLTDGFEESDYDAAGMSPLPRNAVILFREELAWIPGVIDMFPAGADGRLSSIRLIPPRSLSIPSGSPSVFTANRLVLKTYCSQLEDEEIDQVLEALEIFRRDRTLLSDQLDVLLLPNLNRLSWLESGVYTVSIGPRVTQLDDSIATADAGEGASALNLPSRRRPSGRLTATWTGFNSGGPLNDIIRYMEWIYH